MRARRALHAGAAVSAARFAASPFASAVDRSRPSPAPHPRRAPNPGFVDSLWPCDYGLDAFGESGDGFLFSVLDAPVGGPSACTPRGTTVAPPYTPPSPRPAHPAAAQASQPAQEAAALRAAPLVLSVRTKSLRPADAGPPPSPPAAKLSRKRGGDAQPGTPEKQPRVRFCVPSRPRPPLTRRPAAARRRRRGV